MKLSWLSLLGCLALTSPIYAQEYCQKEVFDPSHSPSLPSPQLEDFSVFMNRLITEEVKGENPYVSVALPVPNDDYCEERDLGNILDNLPGGNNLPSFLDLRCNAQGVSYPSKPKECHFSEEGLADFKRLVAQGVSDSRHGKTVLIIDKVAHTLDLYLQGEQVKRYPIGLGKGSLDDKEWEGDLKTPEGVYHVTTVFGKGDKYHKALMLDYPNEKDKKEFNKLKREGKIPSDVSIGNAIEIHGNWSDKCSDLSDWTAGCVAMCNQDIDDLFQRVKPSQNREKLEVVIIRYSSIPDHQ
ncbi:MAG: L,D-transpeptidase family protein [Candidatus Woesearchaeota archaeon]